MFNITDKLDQLNQLSVSFSLPEAEVCIFTDFWFFIKVHVILFVIISAHSPSISPGFSFKNVVLSLVKAGTRTTGFLTEVS